jgi:hypothetical protein
MSTQRDEWAAVAERFGADLEQVRCDHLISHVLAAIAADVPTDDLVFFGGTALSRTHLADARLSEDIDLVAPAPRNSVAAAVEAVARRGLARTHGRPTWRPALTTTRGAEPAVLEVDDTLGIQVQLVTGGRRGVRPLRPDRPAAGRLGPRRGAPGGSLAPGARPPDAVARDSR